MALLAPPAAHTVTSPTRLRAAPRPPDNPPGLLLVPLLDLEQAEATLSAAIGEARRDGAAIHAAVMLPRPRLALRAARRERRAYRVHQEAMALVRLVQRRTCTASVPASTSLHLLRGLRGRSAARVVEQQLSRLDRALWVAAD